MNRDDIIRMAREAGLGFKKGSGWGTHAGTQRFAQLVAAAEREACAQLCAIEANKWPYPSHANAAVTMAATAIRARQEMK